MNGRRFIGVLLCAVLLTFVTACMQVDYDQMLSELERAVAQQDVPEISPEVPERRILRIAVATSPDGIEEGANQRANAGAEAFAATCPGSTVTAVWEHNQENAVRAVSAVAEDYDVVIAVGNSFDGVAEVAQAHPDQLFVLVGAKPQRGIPIPPNFCALLMQEQENGFYAGVAAALETQTGKVAFLGGVPSAEAFRRQLGFEAGVHYANNQLGVNVEIVSLAGYAAALDGAQIGGNYLKTGTSAEGRKAAMEMAEAQCDILYVDDGAFQAGVFAVVRASAGMRVIVNGAASRISADGERDIVLLSVGGDLALAVEQTLESVKEGRFHSGVLPQGTVDGMTGFDSADGHHQLSETVLAELRAVAERMKYGEIVPPDGENGEMPEDFPGLWE